MEHKLTAARLRDLLIYDDDTGAFTNRVTRHYRAKCGAGAGCVSVNGYVEIRIDGTLYYGHRLAWLYMTGEWPQYTIDHIDGGRINNRWTNLRDVSYQTNNQNLRVAQRGSATGLLGVTLSSVGRSVARIRAHGRQRQIGTFDTPMQAHEAYLAAKRVHHAGCTI